jgi:methyl-accepting chemotaxis protein
MTSIIRWFRDENNWLSFSFITHSIRRKQLAAFLIIALIPLIALGIVLYNIAKTALIDQSTEQLSGIRKLKTNIVQQYFAERRKDLNQLTDMLAHFYEMSSDHIQSFERQIVDVNDPESMEPLKAAISPLINGKTTDMIKHYRKKFGFENIFLINTSGFVFHAANHGSDRYTNLLTGPYRNTNLGQLVAKVFEKKSFGMADFEIYLPAQNAPAAFMAQPVLFENDVKFLVAVQLSISQINTVAGERTGLGRTGETYFVGKDKMLRNDSFRMKQQKVMTTILSPEYKVDTEALRSAINGDSGTKLMRNYQGIMTLTSWQPVTIVDPNPVNPDGIRWALITEIDEDEVNQPVTAFGFKMASTMGAAMAGAVLMIIIIAFVISGSLTRQIQHITQLFGEIGIGNYNARCHVVSRDELGSMAHSLNAMLDNTLTLIQSREERDAMQNAIMKLLMDISALTQGDLTIRAEVTEDMTGAIADSFNSMTEQLSKLVRNVKRSTLEVAETSQEVTKSTIKLSRTNDEHAAQINGAVKAIEEMSKSIRVVSQHAIESAKVSDQAKQSAVSGAEAVRRTNSAMNAIRERVQEAGRAIKRLGESSQEIGNIVQIIDDIADRTSILALNASIQAAVAGDAGRGFAVVADEVQRLAEQSSNSTKQIETLVKTIQGEISEAGARMEDSIEQVLHGTRLADGAHNKLEEIEAVSTQLADLVQAISKAANEQAVSSANISATMKEVGEMSSQASVQGKLTALTITNLADTSKQLRESVEAFRLSEGTPDEFIEELNVVNDPGGTKDLNGSPKVENLDILYEVG